MSQQSTAHGSLPQAKYGRLGGFTGVQVAPLERCSMFIFGEPNCGKSNLIQSCPTGFIFNLDGTSTSCPQVQAAIWPGIDNVSGLTMDDNRQPFVLTQEKIDAKVKLLLEMAKANEPRPTTVFFDSVTSWVRILHTWTVANATALNLWSASKPGTCKNFWELEGKAAWDRVYTQIINTIFELKGAGYGVGVMGHVVKTNIPLGEDQYKMEYELTMGAGLWKRLFAALDFSAFVLKTERPFSETVTKKLTGVKNPDGSDRTITEQITTKRPVHILGVTRADMSGLVKSKPRFPEIVLPESGGWQVLSDTYRRVSEEAMRAQEK